MIRNCRLMIFALVLTAIGAASAHGQAPLPLERYFDGSLHGEGGEAFIDRDFPGYYHFTIESLGELERLEQLSFTVVTRQSHAANGHHISVVTAAAGEDDEKLLPLDVYDPDDGSDEAAQAGVESFFIGGGVGTTRHVKVDLSHLKDVEGRRLRIRFDEPRMRSRTALTRLELAGRLRGEAEMVTVAAYRFEDEADRAAPSDRRHGVRVGRLLPQRYPLAEPQHHRFTEYERYVLTLTGALPGGATLILHLGHQHGAFRQAWAETEGVWSLAKAVDASRLKLEAGRLTGTVEVDTGRVPASVDAPGDFPGVIATYRLDIDIKEGKPAGTFQGQWAWRVGNRVTWPEGKLVLEDEDVKWVTRDETEVSGEVSGRILDHKRLREKNAVAAGRDWPNYLGANGGHAAAPSGHELVEDFRDARLVWKSEFTPPGRNQTTRYGEGNIIRYRARSWAGGEASPVVADGRVYLYYFDPAGERMLDYVDESIEVGRAVVRKQWHARADDVFLCVDAETGQTLWKKRFPLAGHNSFAAKGSYTHTPAVDDGILIGRGSAGITYAFEAETGRLLWRGGIGGGHAGIIIDGVYFSPAGGGIDVPLTAVDARTGKELWRIAGTVGHQSIPVRWSHGGEHYVIAGNSAGKVYCVHARSGEVLWTASGLGANIHNLYVDGDHLVANAAPRGEAPQPAGYRITPDGLEHLWTLSAERIEHDPRRTQPVIANGHAWLRCDGRPSRLIVVEMETGRITADVSGPVGEFLYFMDGMIIADQDVSHSNTNLRMIIADPNQPRSEQDGFTSARHRQTSGYWPHPFRHALFDGRIVIRGARGLYCYDLRKPAAE